MCLLLATDAFQGGIKTTRRFPARSNLKTKLRANLVMVDLQSMTQSIQGLGVDTILSNNLGGMLMADADIAVEAVKAADPSWFDIFVNLMESSITLLNNGIKSVTGADSYGISIILFTLGVKGLTYPLTYQQLESTQKMQALQPRVKDIQAKYKSNPEVMNREMSALYQDNSVNPLAGCLPAIVQIPIFIGLYRALLKLAKDDLLNEPFLWLPNLEGPVYGAQNADWLFQNWVDFTPPLGWHDTLCFLSLPVILVISQSYSQKLLTPPKPEGQKMDESQEAMQSTFKYLPIVFGFFALNVPSGLGVYWLINNFVTTGLNLFVKAKVAEEMKSFALAGPEIVMPTPSPVASNEFKSASYDSGVIDADFEPILRDVEGFGAGTADSDDIFAEPTKPKKDGKKKKKKRQKR